MKQIKLLAVTVFFLILTCSSNALAIDAYGFGSYWDQKDTDGVWGGGLGVSLPLFTEHLRLDGRAYLFENSSIGRDDNITITPFDLGLQVHILPSGAVDPYLLAGGSYIYVDSDRSTIDSTFSGYVGVGMDINLGIPLVKLFGEALYRPSELERKFGEDVDTSGFTGNIGLKLHF